VKQKKKNQKRKAPNQGPFDMGARAQEESKTKSGIASRDKESRGITRNHVCMRLKKGARNRFIEVKDRFCLLSFIERQTPSHGSGEDTRK